MRGAGSNGLPMATSMEELFVNNSFGKNGGEAREGKRKRRISREKLERWTSARLLALVEYDSWVHDLGATTLEFIHDIASEREERHDETAAEVLRKVATLLS